MKQVKYSLDKASLIKIAKGSVIAGTGAMALYILDALGQVDVGTFTPLIGALVPIMVNAVKEFMRGDLNNSIYEA